jgi:hypothetical protein
VFDQVLIPALSRAERDALRNELGEKEQAFAWELVTKVLDQLEVETGTIAAEATVVSQANEGGDNGTNRVACFSVVGLAVSDRADALVLRMLRLLLRDAGLGMDVLEAGESPLTRALEVAELSPSLVVVSHLPPGSFTMARYMVRRLRSQTAELPILVGRWGKHRGNAEAADRLITSGATRVLFSVSDAAARVVKLACPDRAEIGRSAPLPA